MRRATRAEPRPRRRPRARRRRGDPRAVERRASAGRVARRQRGPRRERQRERRRGGARHREGRRGDDARLPLGRRRRADRRRHDGVARAGARCSGGSTTGRSPAAWRSRCGWPWRPPRPGIPEVVIAGKARLHGGFPGTRIVGGCVHKTTGPTAGGRHRGERHDERALLGLRPRHRAGEGQGARSCGTRTAASGWTSRPASRVNGFGYGDRKIVAAIKKQAETLIHASNLYHTEPASRLAERLVALAFPSKVFFTNSGTEAWEGAMKFARRIGNEQGRTEYVVFEHSFHGRSMGALSTTWTAKYREPFEPLVPGVRFVPRNDLAAVAAAVNEKHGGGDDRAGAGRGRHPAGVAGVPARPRGALPRARVPPRLRRDPVRPRPHREDVRVPALGRRARHPDARQAARGRAADGCHPPEGGATRTTSRSATTARRSAATRCARRRRTRSSTTSRSRASSTTSRREGLYLQRGPREARAQAQERDRRGPRARAR